MKCQIQWIDEKTGRPTPDENEAVAMVHYHEPIWSHPSGNIDNRIVGYTPAIQQSFPICAEHLVRLTSKRYAGWSYTPLESACACNLATSERSKR